MQVLHSNVGDGQSCGGDGHEEQRTVAEPVESLEEVLLDNSKPNQTTKIGTLASPMVRQALITFLKDNQDVFAWSYEDMPRIDPSVVVHRLNVALLSTHLSKEVGVHLEMRPSYRGRSPQVTRDRLH